MQMVLFAYLLQLRKAIAAMLIELDETEYTDVFGRASRPEAPQRVLQRPFFKEWRSLPTHEREANKPDIGHSTMFS
ncbi:hypothetical protein TSUD_18730 [Trifolium subterraneum]|uniref:Uncharacterized protein n=1 Tax=Trifolium subterraneum TaxID=3900 RepID=A0A2Z6ML23_TRISU|nr:hypothetical protein TSUD_18730 [Trifolium subterraneum]